MNDEALFQNRSEDPDVSGKSAAQEVGKRLSAAREAAHLSQAEVAARLRLGERQIVALETGNLSALPGKTFVRGFVRNYAVALSLDAEPLLTLLERSPDLVSPALNFPESTHTAMPGQRQAERRHDRSFIMWGLLVLVAAMAFAFFAPQNLDLTLESRNGNEESASVLPLEHEALVLEDTSPLTPNTDAASASTSAPASASAASAPAMSSGVVTPASPTAIQVNAQGNAMLRFEFSGASWVEVTGKDNQHLYSQLHEAGAVKEIPLRPPFSVVVGRSSAVRLYYQGELIPLKANANDVAIVRLQ